MSEKQEKVWIVMRRQGWRLSRATPNKVFDDRDDARRYAAQLNKRSKLYRYSVTGVKKG